MKPLQVVRFGMLVSAAAVAGELTPAQTEFFENKIRPVLAEHCYHCHSATAERVKGGLLVDSRDGVLKGGDSGPAIVPGNPDSSLLIKAVRYTDPDLEMPPKGKKLAPQQIADLETWVKMGAPDPRTQVVAKKNWNEAGAKHWAWQPLPNPAPPPVKNAKWCQTPVDNFVLAKLEEKGMKPNPPADKRTLIRRASFDLIGLPPTPAEVEAFERDQSPEAFAKVVDRLLASPQYGERWGRHWLDVARYSDTKGQIRRQREDPNYPYAWTYRDYVIQSFNADKPYNQFIIEQIAGDQVPAVRKNPTNLTALGFLTVGDRFMGMPNDIINDRIDVVTKGFLGLTVTCARCHDHKFDPIPTADYYSLHGIFASTTQPEVETVIEKVGNSTNYLAYYKLRKDLENEKESLELKLRQAQRTRDREAVRKLLREIRQNESAVASLEMTHPGAPMRAMRVQDSTRPKDSPILLRGEAGNKGNIVPRRFLAVLSPTNRVAWTNGSGRLQLAHAISDPANPLTPRVMINRVWQHHFGVGFVPTPDDLGTMSETPSHPELLDYLARKFVTEGWSLKKIHREIMLSSTYQESSTTNPRYAEIDPENRLLWRANIRKLEFEVVRDSLLAIGGTLDTNMFGRPIDLERNPKATRRSVYAFIDRSDLPDAMVNFDFANPDMPNGKRHDTTVPQQALFFMNSPLVIEQARRLVGQAGFNECTSSQQRVQYLYERIFQRLPQATELDLGVNFVLDTPREKEASVSAPVASADPRTLRPRQQRLQELARRNAAATAKSAALSPWEKYAQALLEANEMVFVN